MLDSDTMMDVGPEMEERESQEKTAPQVLTMGMHDAVLPRPRNVTRSFYKKVREMRRDPTVALCRALCVAPVLTSPWSVEAKDTAPEGAQKFITDEMVKQHMTLLRTTFYGCLDFGWQAFEKIFCHDCETGLYKIKKLKPLLQDITEILVTPDHGEYVGVVQDSYSLPQINWDPVYLGTTEALLLNFDVEGGNFYGESTMAIVESVYDKWLTCESGADRYDRKIAGAHWVVHYPIGFSTRNGQKVDNYEIAKGILQTLESSGGIAVPRQVSAIMDDLSNDAPDAWKIELLDAKGGQTGFIDRMKYLDALKARAFGMPERSILEGQFGTKAESEAHADFAIVLMEHRSKIIVEQLNRYLVNQLIRLNWGAKFEDSVYLVAAPIADLEKQALRKLYDAILANPTGFGAEYAMLDMESIRDRLGLPVLPQYDVDTVWPVEPPVLEPEEEAALMPSPEEGMPKMTMPEDVYEEPEPEQEIALEQSRDDLGRYASSDSSALRDKSMSKYQEADAHERAGDPALATKLRHEAKMLATIAHGNDVRAATVEHFKQERLLRDAKIKSAPAPDGRGRLAPQPKAKIFSRLLKIGKRVSDDVVKVGKFAVHVVEESKRVTRIVMNKLDNLDI